MLTEGYMVKYLQKTMQWYYLCRAWTTFWRHQINSKLGFLHSFFIRRLSPNHAREKQWIVWNIQAPNQKNCNKSNPKAFFIAFNIILLFHFLLAQQDFRAGDGVNYLAFISLISFQSHLSTSTKGHPTGYSSCKANSASVWNPQKYSGTGGRLVLPSGKNRKSQTKQNLRQANHRDWPR